MAKRRLPNDLTVIPSKWDCSRKSRRRAPRQRELPATDSKPHQTGVRTTRQSLIGSIPRRLLGLLLFSCIGQQACGVPLNRLFAVAGLFGRGSNDNDRKGNLPRRYPLPPPPPRSGSQQIQQLPPPPPPLPLPQDLAQSKTQDRVDGTNRTGWTNVRPGPMQPHPRPPPPQAWAAPTEAIVSQLRYELDVAMRREQELAARVRNLTGTTQALHSREVLHLRQMDVLTERVVSTEASVASERNRLVEYKENCTLLDRQVAELQGELEEWTAKCSQLQVQHDKDENEMASLKNKVKQATLKAEDLAELIERARLRDDEKFLNRRRHSKPRRGFWTWLFGWDAQSDVDRDDMNEAARSTLLDALQKERDVVDELESAVASLQLNNSVIADQVESRDMIIDELNDRIAVFEEDKVVLKAALKQLQKEMHDEAPKTQKGMKDLADARQEITRLRTELKTLFARHREETKGLQAAIDTKETALQDANSNLTMIGTYVDRLEERLADFAVARRDIDVREQHVADTLSRFEKAEASRESLQKQIETYKTEHEELKGLLAELADAKARVSGERNTLRKEIEGLQLQIDELQKRLQSLESENAKLRDSDSEWQARARDVQFELDAAMERSESLKTRADDSESGAASLRRDVENLRMERLKLQEQLNVGNATIAELEQRLQKVANRTPPPPPAVPPKRRNGMGEPRVGNSFLPSLPVSTNRGTEVSTTSASQTIDKLLRKESLHQEVGMGRKMFLDSGSVATNSSKAGNEFNVFEAVRDTPQAMKQKLDEITPAPAAATSSDRDTGSDLGDIESSIEGELARRRRGVEQQTVAGGRHFLAKDSARQQHAPPKPAAAAKSLPKRAFAQFNAQQPPAASTTSQATKRNVPFRKFRKLLSKATGIHGLLTPSSTGKRAMPLPTQPPQSTTNNAKVSARKSSSSPILPKTPRPLDQVSTQKDESKPPTG